MFDYRERIGGAIMAECIKQTEESKMEGLLREGVHKLLDEMTDEQVEELISYLSWILETPYNS